MFNADLPTTGTGYRAFLAMFLSAVMVGSILAASAMAALQPAMAAHDEDNKKPADKIRAEKNDANRKNDPNFKIRNFYIDNNANLVVTVKGIAGGTTPPKPPAGELGQVYTYAFFTDNGVWVINAHWECHTGSGCDPSEQHVSEWHAEKVALANVDGYNKPCVTGISGERPATIDGHKAIVNVPEATKILSVQTASFNLQTNPDNPTQLCIAELGTVFHHSSHGTEGN